MPPLDPNPLKELLLDEGASLMPYGVEPTEPGAVQRPGAHAPSATVPLLAAAFGPIELEYASLRTDCVIIDRPDRTVIEVTGADSADFLGRMLTQDIAGLKAGESCNSFWLNRKGRIDADLRVMRPPALGSGPDPHRYFLELEAGSLELAVQTLSSYVITEDVTLTPRGDLHRLSLHGPKSHDLLIAADQERGSTAQLRPNTNVWAMMPEKVGCWIDRHDTAGVPGNELLVPRAQAESIYQSLLRRGRPAFMVRAANEGDPGDRGQSLAASKATMEASSGPAGVTPEAIRLRPCGWFAYNIARIEAGTPLFKIDFGPENLPAETGAIDGRINFKKGCYLGQEVVARMHARGHPKQRLVALRFDDDLPPGPDGLPPLPIQGERVLAAGSAEETAPNATLSGAKTIGSITSSTFSPMLGRVPIAFAMVGWAYVTPGTRVMVECEGTPIPATVQEGLRFVPGG